MALLNLDTRNIIMIEIPEPHSLPTGTVGPKTKYPVTITNRKLWKAIYCDS